MGKKFSVLEMEKRILDVIGEGWTEGLRRLSIKVYNRKATNVGGLEYKRMHVALKKLKREGKISMLRPPGGQGRFLVRRLLTTRPKVERPDATEFVTTDSSMPTSVQSLLSGFESTLQKERKRLDRAEELIAELKDIFRSKS